MPGGAGGACRRHLPPSEGLCLPPQDPYFMKNHLGSYECKLCLTLHNNEVGLSATPGVPSHALPRVPACPRVLIHLTHMRNAAEAEGRRRGPACTPDRALKCVSLRERWVAPDEAKVLCPQRPPLPWACRLSVVLQHRRCRCCTDARLCTLGTPRNVLLRGWALSSVVPVCVVR